MTTPRHVYLVIGASRGIGHELVTQLSATPTNLVIATVRKPASFDQANVQTLVLDQTDAESVTHAATQLAGGGSGGGGIDTLILNAAIGEDEKLLSTNEQRLRTYLDTNVVGVHRVVDAFLPALRLRPTRKIVLVSSTSGSLEKQRGMTTGFAGPYSVTKAANNMQVVQYHNELDREAFTVIALHPGWVATDMGKLGGDGGMPVPQSVEGMLKVIADVKRDDSGRFFSYNGSQLPW